MTLRRAWFKAGGKGLRFPNGIPRQETPVTDNLRDRIAYAIAQADGDEPGMEPASCDYEMADAVIEELGLRRDEVGLLHRHVTEWFSDD